MPGDVQALMADSQFQGLAPADKRTVLAGVAGDKSFNSLSDADTMQFVSHVTAKAQASRPDLFPPPSVPRPQLMGPPGQPASSTMQQSALGAIDKSDPGQLQFGGMHGGSYEFAPRDANGQIVDANSQQMQNAALGGTVGAALSPGVIPAATAVVRAAPQAAKTAVKAVPYVAASEGINLLRSKLGKLGKYIPSGAEMLPYFMMGGGEKPPASSESASTAATEAEASGTRVPVGKLAKEVPNPDPYKFSGAPKSMDIVDSTNVGKVGYEADSRTMTVEYKNGFVYSYHGVPPEIYNNAKDAESIGSYISRNVKGRYETVRRGSVLVKKK